MNNRLHNVALCLATALFVEICIAICILCIGVQKDCTIVIDESYLTSPFDILEKAKAEFEAAEPEEPSTPKEPELSLTEDEIFLIAQLTMAEVESEPVESKRMVIDTILNRYEHEHFPDTIHGVIYQKNQFSPMWNGRFERCCVKQEYVDLVYEELASRYNRDVIFFMAGGYSAYGDPLFNIRNCYYSSL